MPAPANSLGSPPHIPPLFPRKFSRAAGSSGTESEFRHAQQSHPSVCDRASRYLRLALRYTRPPQTARFRQAPPVSTAGRPVFPLHSGDSRSPCPCSLRSSVQRYGSPAGGFETLPRQLARSFQTAKGPPQFLALFDMAVFERQWIRSSYFCLGQFQFFRELRIFVIAVQRIASRRQSLPRRRRAIAERSANSLVLDRFSLARINKDFRIRQNRSPQPHRIDPSFAHRRLRHVRQEILQVAVRCADKNEIRETPFQLPCGAHLPRHANQRIFRRLISIRRRIQRRPLNVWIVVRTPRRDIHKRDSQFHEQEQKLNRLRQIHLCRTICVDAESPPVGNQIVKRFRDSRTRLAVH